VVITPFPFYPRRGTNAGNWKTEQRIGKAIVLPELLFSIPGMPGFQSALKRLTGVFTGQRLKNGIRAVKVSV